MKLRYLIPAVLWLSVITWLSVIPNLQLPSVKFFAPDKLGHAGVYGLLSWLLLWGFARAQAAKGAHISARETGGILAFAAAYGVLMEFVQYAFIPGRYYEYGDMLANASGAVLGWLAFRLFSRRKYP
ncbi:MAG: VanZ family protein [Bacteroidota bacterium]